MRRLFIVFLLVLLPLRGWTADVMALGQGLATTDTAAHALCPDHTTVAAGDEAAQVDDGTAGNVHVHCTACQLPAMTAASVLPTAPALPAAQPAAPLAVLIETAPQRQIKPPIA